MGKSTISMAIFNSYVSHYQRVPFANEFLWYNTSLSSLCQTQPFEIGIEPGLTTVDGWWWKNRFTDTQTTSCWWNSLEIIKIAGMAGASLRDNMGSSNKSPPTYGCRLQMAFSENRKIAKNHHAIFWIVVDHLSFCGQGHHDHDVCNIPFISHGPVRWTKSHSCPCLGSRPLRFRWDDPWPCRVTLICIYPPIQEDSSLYGGVQFMRVPPNHPSKTMTYIDLLKAMVTWRSSHHDLRNMKSHENC